MLLFIFSLNKVYGYLQFAIKTGKERPPTMLKRGYYVKEGIMLKSKLQPIHFLPQDNYLK